MKQVDSKTVSNGKHGIVVIKKYQTALGQTVYTKEAHLYDNLPQSRQSASTAQPTQQMSLYNISSMPQSHMMVKEPEPNKYQVKLLIRQQPEATSIPQEVHKAKLMLDNERIGLLLSNPGFNDKISIGKALKIVRVLLEGKSTSEKIAKKFSVDQTFVDAIKACITA
jgi:hypothetical protein